MIQFMLADAIQPQRNYRVWAQLGYDEVISWSIGQILAGLTLAFCSQAALRWIIRPPEMGCPRCGYAVGDGTDTCPECGQTGVG